MYTLVIKKGKKGIFHLPRFMCNRSVYKASLQVSENMFLVDDSCQHGWSKLWGIAFGHIHWHNSYRFVFRNTNGKLEIGYYAYVGGVSPQKNKKLKGYFANVEIKPLDVLELEIVLTGTSVIFQLRINGRSAIPRTTPSPKGLKFPVTRCFPNIKCEAPVDIDFKFL